MSGITPEDMAKATEVLESVRDEWLQRPGVTAIDLGFKWSEGEMTGQLSIRVHVARKKSKEELTEDELFPKELGGFPVDIIEATYAPQAMMENSVIEAAVGGRGNRFDVIPVGVSIGCANSTAGTLGAKVLDLDSGQEMILSNWHVMAGDQNVETGLAVWQPGRIDGGRKPENTIAELTRWILGPYDAAVATVTDNRPVNSATLEGKAIEDITQPMLGMMVWKSGRTTGYTEGFIDGMKMKVPLSYREAGTHLLEEVFRIVPRPGAGDIEVSLGGDSGSTWVDQASGKVVGLHFAGEAGDSPEHALAHDINYIVDALKVRFPGQPPPPPPVIEPPVDTDSPVDPVDPISAIDPTIRPDPDPAPRRSFWQLISAWLKKLFG